MSHLSYLGPHRGLRNSLAQRPTFLPEDKRDKEDFCLGSLAMVNPVSHRPQAALNCRSRQQAGRRQEQLEEEPL